MPGTAGRILVVGHTSSSTQATRQQLERDGWNSHSVDTIVEAEGALKMIRFDVVLAEETIAAGSGYDLTDSVLEQDGTLLVSVALSEASLWLPVVQRGILTLGDRALNSSMLNLEVREALGAAPGTRGSSASRRTRGSTGDPAVRSSFPATGRRTGAEDRRGRAVSKHLEAKGLLPPQRKPAADAAVSIPDDASLGRESDETGGAPSSGGSGRHFR